MFFSVLGMLTFTLLCNVWIVEGSRARMYQDVREVPKGRVGLVLGTSKSLDGRVENPYFTYRMEAAAALYHAGKVEHLLVSGDNRVKRYNEPRDMRDALIALGVPRGAITMDFAGLRTLDSVVRAKKIFGQDSLIIISQGFHNYRALFIAAHHDIEAVALSAFLPEGSGWMQGREYLARTKAVLDLYVFGVAPKYLGEEEPLVF